MVKGVLNLVLNYSIDQWLVEPFNKQFIRKVIEQSITEFTIHNKYLEPVTSTANQAPIKHQIGFDRLVI